MSVRSFSSADEMFKAIAEDVAAADARTEDWQLRVKPGDFVWRYVPEYDLMLYYEVLEPELDEGEEPLAAGFRLVHGFSEACPEGEHGTEHVSSFGGPLTKKLFETARELGWPGKPR